MIEFATTLGIIAGIMVSLGLIWKGLSVCYKFINSIVEGMKILETLPQWKDTVDKAMKELHPNSGTSMKDQLVQACDDITQIKDSVINHVNDTQKHN